MKKSLCLLFCAAIFSVFVGCASWRSYGVRLKYTDGTREIVVERDTLNTKGHPKTTTKTTETTETKKERTK